MILNSLKNIGIKGKIIITLFGNFLIIFLIIYFVIIPQAEFIKKNGQEIIDRRVFLEEQYIKAKKFRETNEEMDLVDDDIQKLDEVFVSYDEDLQFIETLEKIAIDNNVSQKISLGSIKKEQKDEFEKISLEISANGNFLSIMKYLISLETLNYYVNISSLDISKSANPRSTNSSSGVTPAEDDLSDLNRVVCKIKADTYWK